MKTKRFLSLAMAGVLMSSVAISGCGKTEIDTEATAVTINGTEVSLGFANFVARYEQAQRDQIYVTYLGEDAWESDSDGDGQTLEDATKAEIMEMIESWYVLEAHMDEYDVAVTEEELAAIEETATQFLADNSQETIDQMGATQEYVEQMLYYTVLEDKMQEAIGAQAVITVTDEDAAQRTFSYIVAGAYGKYDESGTYVEYTEEELADVRKKAEDAVARAKTDFDAVAEEFESTDMTYSYGANEETLEEVIIEAADALEEGEISDLIEGANGFYVLRLDSAYDEEATQKEKSSLIAQERVAYYEDVVAGWLEEATIELDEKLWANVKFDSLFTIAADEGETTTTE